MKRVLRGSRREETTRFVGFRSHWRFESEFCTPAEGHEKGGVESEVGRFRRNHWVPVPRADDLEALNRQLLAACQADEARTVAGREQSVGAGLLIERAHLLPLAEDGFDLAEVSFPTVTSLSCVKVKTNAYSVPVKAGRTVEVKLSAASVEIWHEGKRVARHERCYGRYQEIFDLEHYLDVLERKPGALAGSKPLAQWRKLGRWPESYDRFWQALIARHGRQAGTKEMIGLLQLGRVHGPATLLAAIDAALVLGCTDEAAVRHLVTAPQLEHARSDVVVVGALAQFERPLPTVGEYDQLLGQRQVELPTPSSAGAPAGWPDDRATWPDGGPRRARHQGALQAAPPPDHRRAVRPPRRAGRARAPQLPGLPRRAAPSRARGAGAEHRRPAAQGRAPAAGQDPRGV